MSTKKEEVVAMVSSRVRGKTKNSVIISSIGKRVVIDLDGAEECQCGIRVGFISDDGKAGFIITKFLITHNNELIRLGAQPANQKKSSFPGLLLIGGNRLEKAEIFS